MKKIIDYNFNQTTVSNSDGSLPATILNPQLVPGPGLIGATVYNSAFDFGAGTSMRVSTGSTVFNKQQFCVSVVFKVSSAVEGRQNIFESTALPVAIYLEKGINGHFNIWATVENQKLSWIGTNSFNRIEFKNDTWYEIHVVYDKDTLAIIYNNDIICIAGFPDGRLKEYNGNALFIGTWIDGAQWHFSGCMAGIIVYDGIPSELENIMDGKYSKPEWYITKKYWSLINEVNLGGIQNDFYYEPVVDSYIQEYTGGLISYSIGHGLAFEMHGAIAEAYKRENLKSIMGQLLSDELDARRAGAKKSLFTNGGIYWSSVTGAIPVTGKIYMQYENLLESGSFLQMPVEYSKTITAGQMQVFQGGHIYSKNSEFIAFEVHGAILNKFIETSGTDAWGYPIGNETSILNKEKKVIGKYSEFEKCTIYWSPETGAHIVTGEIRRKYVSELGGPSNEYGLGFPISDESNVPESVSRYNSFQNGIIVVRNGSAIVCPRFRIRIDRIDTVENEGYGQGENDLYIKFRVYKNENPEPIFSKHLPEDTKEKYWNGKNVVDVNSIIEGLIITPNSFSDRYRIEVDVWDYDDFGGGGDDHMGSYNFYLGPDNLWGFHTLNAKLFDSGPFEKIKSIQCSLKPLRDPNAPKDFWGFINDGDHSKNLPDLTRSQYAAAFDIDSDGDFASFSDYVEDKYYESIKDKNHKGVCFGMTLEAINAHKDNSRFSLPLSDFKSWNYLLDDEIVIKHFYQYGANPVWWNALRRIGKNTNNPVEVFNSTRAYFQSGSNPIISLRTKKGDETVGHAVYPIGWDDLVKPARIYIFNPNTGNTITTMLVDLEKNKFYYDAGDGNIFQSDKNEGGINYIPYSLINQKQRIPSWDVALNILNGVIIMLGDNTQMNSITDANGKPIDDGSLSGVQNVHPLFVPHIAVAGDPIAEAFKRRKDIFRKMPTLIPKNNFKLWCSAEGFSRNVLNRKTTDSKSNRPLIQDKLDYLTLNNNVKNELYNIPESGLKKDRVNQSNVTGDLRLRNLNVINEVLKKLSVQHFIQHLSGSQAGDFDYLMKHKLSSYNITSAIKAYENQILEIEGLGTDNNVFKITAGNNKTFSVRYEQRIGNGKDLFTCNIDKIPLRSSLQAGLNIRSGSNGLELMTVNDTVEAEIKITAVLNGNRIEKSFITNIEGGMRLDFSSFFNEDSIKLNTIDNLFGNTINKKIIFAR